MVKKWAPIIVLANYAPFRPRQTILNPDVESRMCLWCKAGAGTVEANGQAFSCTTGDYLFLPWHHRIRYTADAKRPFLLAGIHLIPWHARNHAVHFEVSHNAQHPLHQATFRQDRSLGILEGIHQFHLDADSPLLLLSEYIIRLYRRGEYTREQMQQMASVLLAELQACVGGIENDAHDIPPELQELMQYIRASLHRPLTLEDLARQIGRSLSHVGRLFKTYLETTPIAWIQRQKMEAAKELLTTTHWPIGKIAREVGMDDAFYFSKSFKRHTGSAPLVWRKQQHIL